MKHSGVPIRALKPLEDLYEAPLWSWHDDILLRTNSGRVYLCHGKSGVYGKMPKEMGASCVQGHFHGKFEITYHKSVLGTRFNMFIGCLVDEHGLAMAYGKNHLPKPILGTGGLKSSGEPVLFPYRGHIEFAQHNRDLSDWQYHIKKEEFHHKLRQSMTLVKR
jgi:hypothetical protein